MTAGESTETSAEMSAMAIENEQVEILIEQRESLTTEILQLQEQIELLQERMELISERMEVRAARMDMQNRVQVRNQNSDQARAPLYVIDGVSVDNIDHVAPGDIQSMEVLKDAAAAAKYGARGANGVVLITTRGD